MASIDTTINGEALTLDTDPLRRVVDILRDDLGLTGVHEGCGEGACGACCILLDDQLVNACLLPGVALEGRRVLTIEGLRTTERFPRLAEAFEKHGAVQCGFCTPALLMAAEALLRRTPQPSRDEIVVGIDGNLCRCTGYRTIIEAIESLTSSEAHPERRGASHD